MWRILFLAVLLSACSQDEDLGTAQNAQAIQSRPNILLIVADDLGYSDIGAFGSEILTPNLDELATRGMSLTNFYSGPTCSVTRSMLMTGMDSHIAGLGNMAETVADNQMGQPGYEGYLSARVDTVAEILKSAGYHTYMAGKWHLGIHSDRSPRSRGFEQSFAMLYGAGSHFSDMAGGDMHRHPVLYRDNGLLIDELPDDFYSTTFYTDRIIEQIDSNVDDGRPFFAYLAYTAPHWPLQAPDSIIDKYRGRYDRGYDSVRQGRFAAQQKLGLFDSSIKAPQRPGYLKPWVDLSDQERIYHAGNMEIYAAMIDYMDTGIGRVIDYLDTRDQLDNTIIVFISDNGAEHWDHSSAPPPIGEFAANFDNSSENSGREGSFVLYGSEWAHVSNTPFSRYKGTTYEGGIRSPAVISWPNKIASGQVSRAITHSSDWLPTFAELAGAGVQNVSGKSLVGLLTGSVEQVRDSNQAVGMEIWGKRGIIANGYKFVSSGKPNELVDWELYNLQADPGEQIDLAQLQPEVFNSMLKHWNDYVASNNVILPEGPFTVRPAGEKPVE
ncbi:arylsulfatase [Porticoccaceae bacterium]|nr:arylsulfatase [Porticoccaceae bacterium]MDB2558809.1 arylsulfatase [Porticoccaceae bacterium]